MLILFFDRYVPKLLSATPIFEYELLTEGLRCQASFKLENLQVPIFLLIFVYTNLK